MLTSVENIVFTTTLVLSLFIALTSAQNAPTASPFDKLAEHFFFKCQNRTKTTVAFDKLYADSVEFKTDLQYAFSFIPTKKSTFCDSQKRQLENRLVEISNDLKPCLAPQEQYLANFIRESSKEFLHFLCHKNGENIDEFFHPRSAACRSALETDGSTEIGVCFSRIFKPASGTPSKKELCEDLTTAKKCFAEVLNQRCPTYTAYKILNEDFFKYVSKPCSGCTFFLNTLMLVASVMVSYFSKKLL
ncbi:unnamed protein product [Phaedon cochleariae]|uniref:Uncharacterized protein n=1 Tax=Phaedon cochleariae TaxID=80249 RepID=A0A9P0GQ35_PHACE|nr:unnamed protein product [Phaedon cochleariae]